MRKVVDEMMKKADPMNKQILSILLIVLLVVLIIGVVLMEALFISLPPNAWDGYVAATNFSKPAPLVTFVNGSWIVPTLQPGTPSKVFPHSWDAKQWIGIGGFHSDANIIQIGTETTYYGNNDSLAYYAWYEYFPRNKSVVRNFTVLPNDTMYASVTCLANCSSLNSQVWKLSLEDITRNEIFENTSSFKGTMTYAEWVVELISKADILSNRSIGKTPTYFGPSYTHIDSDYATINGSTRPISLLNYVISRQSDIEPVSNLSNGTSFIVK
jgi:hypothetical protein